jgi:hypothetical protein
MPFGSSARFKSCITASSTGSRAAQLRGAQAADAVLGTEAAAEALDQIEHRLSSGSLRAGSGIVAAAALAHVEMQVAVADVSVGDHFALGREVLAPSGCRARSARERRNRHRHIVLEARAVTALRLRHRFAQLPHRLRPADRGRDHRVAIVAAPAACLQLRGQQRAKAWRGFGEESSTSTYQGLLASGLATPGHARP